MGWWKESISRRDVGPRSEEHEESPPSPGEAGRPGRHLGFVQFDPTVLQEGGLAGEDEQEDDGFGLIEAHLKTPTFAARGAWHVVVNLCGVQYGLPPFRGTSLFFQRGMKDDCGLVACQSALMITQLRVGGKPKGINDLMGGLIHELLLSPQVRKLPPGRQRDLARAVQRKLETRKPSSSFPAESLNQLITKKLGLSGGETFDRSLFDLIAGALSRDRDEGSHMSDFGCSAVSETVPCDEIIRSVLLKNDPERWPEGSHETVRQVLTDYLNDGYPIVARVRHDELPEYRALMTEARMMKKEAEGEPKKKPGEEAPSAEEPAPVQEDHHAFLILGFHWARSSERNVGRAATALAQEGVSRTDGPNESEANTAGRTVDAFVVSDLSHTHLLTVGARHLCDAMAVAGTGMEEQVDSKRESEFLIVLPKGVKLGAFGARFLSLEFLFEFATDYGLSDDELARTRDPERYALRCSLFTAGRALAHLAPVVSPEDRDAWKACFGLGTGEENPAPEGDPPAARWFWLVELHHVGTPLPPDDPGQVGNSEGGPEDDEEAEPWAPHRPEITLFWDASISLPESEDGNTPPRPVLVADVRNKKLWLGRTRKTDGPQTWFREITWVRGAKRRHV